jgi:hypothetical protein
MNEFVYLSRHYGYWPLSTLAGSMLLARRAGYQLANKLSNSAVTST